MAQQVVRLVQEVLLEPRTLEELSMKIRDENQGSRVRLTRKVIDNAQDEHVRGKRLRLWDTEVRKLFLQITPAGSASY